MGTRPYETTNARLAEALAIVDELIEWANEDEAHARSHGARRVSADDIWRGNRLSQARRMLAECER